MRRSEIRRKRISNHCVLVPWQLADLHKMMSEFYVASTKGYVEEGRLEMLQKVFGFVNTGIHSEKVMHSHRNAGVNISRDTCLKIFSLMGENILANTSTRRHFASRGKNVIGTTCSKASDMSRLINLANRENFA